jgi:membrane fusion protein (multidrug efflux system)
MNKSVDKEDLVIDKADIVTGQSSAMGLGALTRTINTKRLARTLLMTIPVLILAFIALWVYATGGRWMQTENAYIKADKAQISAQISANITQLSVRDNQHVQAGDVLFMLDAEPFRLTLDAARAAHDEALGQIMAAKENYKQRLGERGLAVENLAFAERELKRRKELSKRKIVAKATLDEYVHDRDVAASRLRSKTQELSVLRALLGDPNADVHHHPRVRGALAKVQLAEQDLAHATILAPIAGTTGSVPVLGNFVRAGTPAMVVVSDTDMWVEANFKETALTHMRIGQKANLRVDAYPDVEFSGRITSIDPATGSEFSLLPAQNASGNWVKVVQRVPVRVSITPRDNTPILRAGMSVHVRIDTGHHRSLPALLRAPLRWLGADVG